MLIIFFFLFFFFSSACEFRFIERIGAHGKQNPGFIYYIIIIVFLLIIVLILIIFRIIDNKCIMVYVNYSPLCLRHFLIHSSSFCVVLGIIPSACGLSDTSPMSFSLDKTVFLASADVSQEASCDSPPPPLSTGSSSSASAPSKCHRRMSKPVFDLHTVCFQCRGFDCD